jgi:hypothetical protein
MGLLGADLKTPAAAYTAGGIKLDLRLCQEGLRIMAPDTAAATALEKNRSPDPRTVMDRETLYIENGPPAIIHVSDKRNTIPLYPPAQSPG